MAALAGEECAHSGHGRVLSHDSPVANAYLEQMTEDQTMQAVLWFARGDSGAVVLCPVTPRR